MMDCLLFTANIIFLIGANNPSYWRIYTPADDKYEPSFAPII